MNICRNCDDLAVLPVKPGHTNKFYEFLRVISDDEKLTIEITVTRALQKL